MDLKQLTYFVHVAELGMFHSGPSISLGFRNRLLASSGRGSTRVDELPFERTGRG